MADPSNDPHTLPLLGTVICCTGISPDLRSTIAYKSSEMGARTVLDLTSDVTHLVCCALFSAKYNYVSRMRADVKVLSTDFIEKMYDRWLHGDDIDRADFERTHKFPIFHKLAISVTGIPDVAERQRIEEICVREGATYHPDLTRRVTHLLAMAPTGKKWEFAKQHNMVIVHPLWFWQSVERGMALEERFYDLSLESEMIGVGARPEVAPQREVGEVRGKRKIKRRNEAELGSQGLGLWDEIRSYTKSQKKTAVDEWEEGVSGLIEEPEEDSADSALQPDAAKEVQRGIFWDACFLLEGFTRKQELTLIDVLASADGNIAPSPEKLQESKKSLKFALYPREKTRRRDYGAGLPPDIPVATEWWIEDCIYHKKLLDVKPDDITTMPFEDFPMEGLEGLNVSITQIYHTDFLHWKKLIKLMGANFNDTLTKSGDVLITSDNPKGPKFAYALANDIPVVGMNWMIESIKAAKKLPYDDFRIYAKPKAPLPAPLPTPPPPADGEPKKLPLLGDRFMKRKPEAEPEPEPERPDTPKRRRADATPETEVGNLPPPRRRSAGEDSKTSGSEGNKLSGYYIAFSGNLKNRTDLITLARSEGATITDPPSASTTHYVTSSPKAPAALAHLPPGNILPPSFLLPAPSAPKRVTSDLTHLRAHNAMPTSTAPQKPPHPVSAVLAKFRTADFSAVIAAQPARRQKPKLRGRANGTASKDSSMTESTTEALGSMEENTATQVVEGESDGKEESQKVLYVDEEAERERGRVRSLLDPGAAAEQEAQGANKIGGVGKEVNKVQDEDGRRRGKRASAGRLRGVEVLEID